MPRLAHWVPSPRELQHTRFTDGVSVRTFAARSTDTGWFFDVDRIFADCWKAYAGPCYLGAFESRLQAIGALFQAIRDDEAIAVLLDAPQ